MKKIIKLFITLIIGIIFVACSEDSKSPYKLEGTYTLERESFFKDGSLAKKSLTEIIITKNGKKYTINGKEFAQEKYRNIDYATKKIKEEYWEDVTNTSFSFTGKIVKVAEQKPANNIPHEKEYVYILENDMGQKINLFIYKNINKEKMLNRKSLGYNDVINLNSVPLDMVQISTKDNLNIQYIEAFKK